MDVHLKQKIWFLPSTDIA